MDSQNKKDMNNTDEGDGTVQNENLVTLTDGFGTQRVTAAGNSEDVHGNVETRSNGSWTIGSMNRRYYTLSKLPADFDLHPEKERPSLVTQFSDPVSSFRYQDPPGDIAVKQLKYSIDPDSITQIDISWDPPLNATSLKSLGYQVQLKTGNDSWKEIGTRNVPVIRMYNTGDCVMLNKNKWNFKDGRVVWWLRVRGMVKTTGFAVYGPWCEDIRIDIKGSSNDMSNFKSDSTRDKSGNILF